MQALHTLLVVGGCSLAQVRAQMGVSEPASQSQMAVQVVAYTDSHPHRQAVMHLALNHLSLVEDRHSQCRIVQPRSVVRPE